ncbi:MAG: response regulator [Bradyrhizobiaceae bacterium]|nr:response regulator [Bradyrhizobiaceae bacterium]
MDASDKVTILLVDDQPSKLLSYEVILQELGERLVTAQSAAEALQYLLKNEVAIVLVDVCMPDLDGFQLAAMIREHPRFQKTAIIFISAVHLSDVDRVRGYEMGAVDYVPVPVIPEVLRAKVKVFAELYRKTRQLEQFNRELEQRVAERTSELERSTARLLESERRRAQALAAGGMGSWEWDVGSAEFVFDEGQYRIVGVDPESFPLTPENIRSLIHPEDWANLEQLGRQVVFGERDSLLSEFRIVRPNGEVRRCILAAAGSDASNPNVRLSGVTIDITERREAEERQGILAREVDHRARNALAVVQSIVRLTKANSIEHYKVALEGRLGALARAHVLLSEFRWQGADLKRLAEDELSPYCTGDTDKIVASGPNVILQPAPAQTLALAIHELATNAAKYGALSSSTGKVRLTWDLNPDGLELQWFESGGPRVTAPATSGYGTRVVTTSVEGQLGGRTTFAWRAEGLHCTLWIPAGEKLQLAGRRRNGHAGTPVADDARSSATASANRMLIAEDEALVALMMEDLAIELGWSVVGPFSRAADALAAAQCDEIHAAILDVNLGGESVYPIADALMARGVPFVFATGYGAESIDRRFACAPVLQKPIDRQALEHAFNRQDFGPTAALGLAR